MRKTRVVLAGLALVASVSSCADSTTDSGTYDLVEYDIVGPSWLDPATSTIQITNSGEYGHTLVVTDMSGQVVEASPLISPGESAELTIDLEPGRYDFTCRIVVQSSQGDLIDHFEQGMGTTVSVGG